MTTTVPLDDEQMQLLLKLTWEWDLAPRDALTRALQHAVDDLAKE